MAPDLDFDSCSAQDAKEAQHELNCVSVDPLASATWPCPPAAVPCPLCPHHHVDAAPEVPLASELDKAACGPEDSCHTAHCGQAVSIDFAFVAQKSSEDNDRLHSKLVGIAPGVHHGIGNSRKCDPVPPRSQAPSAHQQAMAGVDLLC